jgi:hypothetical protein
MWLYVCWMTCEDIDLHKILLKTWLQQHYRMAWPSLYALFASISSSGWYHVRFVLDEVVMEHVFIEFLSPINHESIIAPHPSITASWGVRLFWQGGILLGASSLWCHLAGCRMRISEAEFRDTLRLAVYRQSVCLDDKPLENHDQ